MASSIIDKYTNATLGAGMIVEVVESGADLALGHLGASLASANLLGANFMGADSKRYSPQEKALNVYIYEF